MFIIHLVFRYYTWSYDLIIDRNYLYVSKLPLLSRCVLWRVHLRSVHRKWKLRVIHFNWSMTFLGSCVIYHDSYANFDVKTIIHFVLFSFWVYYWNSEIYENWLDLKLLSKQRWSINDKTYHHDINFGTSWKNKYFIWGKLN